MVPQRGSWRVCDRNDQYDPNELYDLYDLSVPLGVAAS
jgi:hypothetical protein